jgi:hypothetical protein
VVASCPSFLIGDTGPAGGIVFYLKDSTGAHGLEAAPVDQYADWHRCFYRLVIAGHDYEGVGSGKVYTEIINESCGLWTVAGYASRYSLNGVSDWYLPSRYELNLMYIGIGGAANVGGFAGYNYWSSTESDANNAWTQYLNTGEQYQSVKTNALGVRAIRAF